MKTITHYALLFWAALFLQTELRGQAVPLTADFKTTSIERLSQLINEHYVFPDVAQQTGEHLKQQLAAGAFESCTDLKTFAEALTREVQLVNHDKHMRIRPAPPARNAAADAPERVLENQLLRMAGQKAEMAGFREAKRLEGNIGYLDLRGFANAQRGIPVADRYMGLLAGCDALIVDLRKNGGGDPAMVRYLCSFFFSEKTHLNSLYWREGDHTEDFWTLAELGAPKMPDVPLFVLTSNYTFSGAEEFCYNLQTRKRATIVGETTGGGANPGGMFPVNPELGVFIPTGRAINPVTKTNWEGVGVKPEVATPADAAFDKALELATEAAQVHRQKLENDQQKLIAGLIGQLGKLPGGSSEEAVFQQFQTCLSAGLFGEADINAMGYAYLLEFRKPEVAELVFRCNTRLFPKSANVYDSYAEALLANGKKDAARANYKKAVELAEAAGDPNLEMFRTNLQAVDQPPAKRP